MVDRFKVGDEIRIARMERGSSPKVGETGTIRRCDNDGYPAVLFPNGTELFVRDSQMELVKAAAPVAAFKVGDVIETGTDAGDHGSKPPGSIGVVHSVNGEWVTVEFAGWADGHDGSGRLRRDNGIRSRWIFLAGVLKPHVWKVGESVTFKRSYVDPEGLTIGVSVGVISHIGYDGAYVDFPGWRGGHDGAHNDDSKSSWWFSEAFIIPAQPKPVAVTTATMIETPEIQYGFKVGDRVRVKDKQGFRAESVKIGDLGTVKGFWDGGVNVHVDGKGEPQGVFARRVEPAPYFVAKVGDHVSVKAGWKGCDWRGRENGNAATCRVLTIDLSDEGLMRLYLRESDGQSGWCLDTHVLAIVPEPVAAIVPAPVVAKAAFETAKIGDWVTVKDGWHSWTSPDAIAGAYQVDDVDHRAFDSRRLQLRYAADGESRWCADSHVLAIVPAPIAAIAPRGAPMRIGPARETFIVISDEGPSSRPFVHPSRGAAESEAARLALKIPGMKFTVYQAVTSVKAPKPEAAVEFLDAA